MQRAADLYKQFAVNAFAVGQTLANEGTHVRIYYDPTAREHDVRAWAGAPFMFAPQEGNTLGERMLHAFDQTFLAGARQSVIIGTDIPELQALNVRQAFERLTTCDVVLGPATDGGYYLLGMNAPLKDVFSGVAWSTSSVLNGTLERIEALALSWSFLTPLSDIDTCEDYNAYLRRREKHIH